MSKPDTPAADALPTHSHVMHALYELGDHDSKRGIAATDVVEHVVERTGLSSADVRDSLEYLHLNGEIYESEVDRYRRTLQNDERWERFGTACDWQESLAEARMAIGRGLRPRELAERYDLEDPDRIEELVTRATLEVDNSTNGKLTLDDLDKAAERMGISRIVTDGGVDEDLGHEHIYVGRIPGAWKWSTDYDVIAEWAGGEENVSIMHTRAHGYVLDLSGKYPFECSMNRRYDCGHGAYGPPRRLPPECSECKPVTTDGGTASNDTERPPFVDATAEVVRCHFCGQTWEPTVVDGFDLSGEDEYYPKMVPVCPEHAGGCR